MTTPNEVSENCHAVSSCVFIVMGPSCKPIVNTEPGWNLDGARQCEFQTLAFTRSIEVEQDRYCLL